MNSTFWIIGGGLALVFLFTGCTNVGKPMQANPASGAAAADGWYIQSTPTQGARPFLCSFVEFDGRRDYTDFQQHRDALKGGSASLFLLEKQCVRAFRLLALFPCFTHNRTYYQWSRTKSETQTDPRCSYIYA